MVPATLCGLNGRLLVHYIAGEAVLVRRSDVTAAVRAVTVTAADSDLAPPGEKVLSRRVRTRG